MTSSTPGDNMRELHDEDIFLVNRDPDGTGNYETYKVKYEEIKKAVTGPTGPGGASGSQGSTGATGAPGLSVKILGYFDTYDDLSAFAVANASSIEEGHMYVVGNDFMGNSIDNPGVGFCEDPLNPTDITCKKNVAYVWAIGAGNLHGAPTGGNSFVRIAQLTGDPGATGPHYNNLQLVIDDDYTGSTDTYDYTLQFRDTILSSETYDPLPDLDLTVPDVRGATGCTGPYYDSIFAHPDNNETVDGSGKIIARDYRLIFRDTKNYADDPNSFPGLPDFVTDNLVGADGPEGGPMGPTGPYYDDIEHREGPTEYPSNDPVDSILGYVPVYLDHLSSAAAGGLPKIEGDINIKGPRGPAGPPMDPNELSDLLLQIFPPNPPDGGVDDGAPWVHKGADCNSGVQNVNEDIYGEKSFRKTVTFKPCNTNQEIMRWNVGSGRDFRMFFRKDVSGMVSLDGFALQRENGGNPGLLVGFEKGTGSPQIGIKTATPQYALDVKGAVVGGSISARPNSSAGQPVSTGMRMDTSGIQSYGPELVIKGFEGRTITTKVDCTFRLNGPTGGFKINGKTFASGGGSEYMRWGGGFVYRTPTALFSTSFNNSDGYSLGEYADGSIALSVIKDLKPRTITKDGNTWISIAKEDMSSQNATRLKASGNDSDVSLETMVSMLVLSIQKLEERISALESA